MQLPPNDANEDCQETERPTWSQVKQNQFTAARTQAIETSRIQSYFLKPQSLASSGISCAFSPQTLAVTWSPQATQRPDLKSLTADVPASESAQRDPPPFKLPSLLRSNYGFEGPVHAHTLEINHLSSKPHHPLAFKLFIGETGNSKRKPPFSLLSGTDIGVGSLIRYASAKMAHRSELVRLTARPACGPLTMIFVCQNPDWQDVVRFRGRSMRSWSPAAAAVIVMSSRGDCNDKKYPDLQVIPVAQLSIPALVQKIPKGSPQGASSPRTILMLLMGGRGQWHILAPIDVDPCCEHSFESLRRRLSDYLSIVRDSALLQFSLLTAYFAVTSTKPMLGLIQQLFLYSCCRKNSDSGLRPHSSTHTMQLMYTMPSSVSRKNQWPFPSISRLSGRPKDIAADVKWSLVPPAPLQPPVIPASSIYCKRLRRRELEDRPILPWILLLLAPHSQSARESSGMCVRSAVNYCIGEPRRLARANGRLCLGVEEVGRKGGRV
ncbi:hypothetical protein B0H11DRAFT_2188558 [Mycena galericulata]|nr:hypothetical protein B0H11DRAFT_2188558 [Mycena galericulata]